MLTEYNIVVDYFSPTADQCNIHKKTNFITNTATKLYQFGFNTDVMPSNYNGTLCSRKLNCLYLDRQRHNWAERIVISTENAGYIL